MEGLVESRRAFLRTTGLAAGALLVCPKHPFAAEAEASADYTVRIKAAPIEIAPNQILSSITYNGQFPGPLIRFKEGRQVTVDIFNETIRLSSCIGMARSSPPTSTARPRKARLTFRPAGDVASPSRPCQRGCVSITRTIALAPIFPRANTADRLDRFTSSRRTIQATTIAKSFSS